MNNYEPLIILQPNFSLPQVDPQLRELQERVRRLLEERGSNVRPEISALLDPHPQIVTPDLILAHPGIVDNLHRRFSREYREAMDKRYFEVYDEAARLANIPREVVIRLIDHYYLHRNGKSPLTPVRRALIAKAGAHIYQGVRVLGLNHHEAVS